MWNPKQWFLAGLSFNITQNGAYGIIKILLLVDILIIWEGMSFWDILTLRELYLLLFIEMILRQCSLRLA